MKIKGQSLNKPFHAVLEKMNIDHDKTHYRYTPNSNNFS